MSGGHFDYQQYRLHDMATEIKRLIDSNGVPDEYGYVRHYKDITITKFKKAIELLRQAETYVQRIDWLVSGDDSEESFHKRLKEELRK